MKTFIYVRNSDNTVVGVGSVRLHDGSLSPALIPRSLIVGEEAAILEHAQKHAPTGVTAKIVDTADLPGNGMPDLTFDKTFFSFAEVNSDGEAEKDESGYPINLYGWNYKESENKVEVNIEKAKLIAHSRRRLIRGEEFKKHDREVTIPTKAESAEAARQNIRDRHAQIQSEIDDAVDIASLLEIVKGI